MTTWRELYQLANEFKQAAMWEKFCDRDLFCVKDKSMEEPLYLCIMGNAGRHFSLTAYVGESGYATYLEMREANLRGNALEALDGFISQD